MSYLMNKVKCFAYLPSQQMVGQIRASKHILKLGLTYKFLMNNPDFETQQHITIWCNNLRNMKNFNTTPQNVLLKKKLYFSIIKVDFWNFNLGVRKSLECRIFNHLPQSFWGPWAAPRPPAVVGTSAACRTSSCHNG